MKRATLVVTYHGTQIYTVTAMPRKGLVDLLVNNTGVKPYDYESFRDMCNAVLSISKHSGYMVGGTVIGGRTYYDIIWIDTHNPTRHEQFSISTSAPSLN